MKNILEIKEISYGEFPQISGLNPRFKPGSRKVKVVLDVQLPDSSNNTNLSLILSKLMKLFPSLEKHQCGEQLLEDLKSGKKTYPHEGGLTDCSSHSDKITDLAHLMEHVIIDLQSNITGMDSCSGITCGYKNPYYRFDMFVECKDKKVGLFSVFLTTNLFGNLLTRKNLSKTYPALIDLAKYLYRNKSFHPRTLQDQNQAEFNPWAGQISKELGWRKNFVLSLLSKLKDFGFFNGNSHRGLD